MPTGSVAALNIKFTADIKGVNRAIREAEKSLKSATQTFSSIGNQLSLALSAPIAAFVATSVKAAGELESLKLAMRTTFEGAGRSISEADAELEKLREAAMAPGLDFEQAVKGSLRLQGVGKSAEESRRIIVQLANALASVGGTSDQLDGVTKQFAQIIGKGKIMQEDLSIILENMPNLAKVLKDEFGTGSAEGLRKLGISADDFVTRLTNRMETLPRVSGGIANSIVNAGNAMKMALARVGEELNKTFDITGKLDAFANWISTLAERFSNLSEGTKRAIAAAATFAFALGPLFKVMQPIVWVSGKIYLGFLDLKKILLESQGGALTGFITKWKALDYAMKVSIIGATVAVVLALAAAFVVLQKDMSATAQAERAVTATRDAAVASIATERANIEVLTRIASDEKRSKEERLGAMKELIAISPTYSKALKDETIDTDALKAATDDLVNSMIRSATARKATEDIAAIDEQLRHLAESSAPSFLQTLGNSLMNVGGAFGNYSGLMNRQTKTQTENMNENRAALEKTREELMKLATENVHALGTQKETTKGFKENKDGVDELAKSYRELDKTTKLLSRKEQTADLGKFKGEVSPGIDAGTALPESLMSDQPANRFTALADSIRIAGGEMSNYLTISEQVGAIHTQIQDGMVGVGDSLIKLGENLRAHGELVTGIALTVAGALDGIAESGGGIGEMAAGIVNSLKKIIGGLIKTGVTAVVTKALLSSALNPFAALALGAATGAIAQGLFNSLINSIKVPALAHGGVITSPTVALMGEYANARVNPEIVAPEKKLRDVFRGEMKGRMGGTLTAVVSGKDLRFILEQAGYDAQRTRGY